MSFLEALFNILTSILVFFLVMVGFLFFDCVGDYFFGDIGGVLGVLLYVILLGALIASGEDRGI